MIIEKGNLKQNSLQGRVAIITGGGGGIGYEAARALLWLGCKIVIAEINRVEGKRAAQSLANDFKTAEVLFIQTDVGDERSVKNLAQQIEKTFGNADIVLNNATIAPLGAVKDLDIKAWDDSYKVNLRGPVLLARTFIPGMIARNWGVFACVSSTGIGYMAAYESLKAAQVHLGNSLNDELENTNVAAFTIGPGFAPTQTAASSIPKLAILMGKPESEIQEALKAHILSIEAAGAGFAAAIAMASRYRGQEISSMQALADAGIDLPTENQLVGSRSLTEDQFIQALELCQSAYKTLTEESAGWKSRSIFEQQWLIRTFRQKASLPVDEWLRLLEKLETALRDHEIVTLQTINPPFDRLASYYGYLYEMAKGYVKNPEQKEEQLRIVSGWKEEIEQLQKLLG
jgi:NAD(P)-dependent dehydrogenase (short-subunit alcohol dehydrogenase family)